MRNFIYMGGEFYSSVVSVFVNADNWIAIRLTAGLLLFPPYVDEYWRWYHECNRGNHTISRSLVLRHRTAEQGGQETERGSLWEWENDLSSCTVWCSRFVAEAHCLCVLTRGPIGCGLTHAISTAAEMVLLTHLARGFSYLLQNNQCATDRNQLDGYMMWGEAVVIV